MEILFKTRKLQKTMSSETELIRQYGKSNARLIMRRLIVLDAADCLADVSRDPPERCHALSGRRKGQYAVDVKSPHRIILEPADDPLPIREDSSIDLTRVTSIRILEVKDYH